MRCAFFSILFFLSCPSFAQNPFQHISLAEALQKAKSESKFVFLQFEAADCSQCNDVANKGLDNKELAAKLEQHFVCLKIEAGNPERNSIAANYNLVPQKSFGTFFLDANGTLLHSFLRTTSRSQDYAAQLEIALTKAGEVLNINQLENEYKNGNKGFGFLEMLLLKRKAVHLSTDALLDEYIDVLPADSLKSMRVLRFIAQMAPMIDSKADKTMRADRSLFSAAWYGMPVGQRMAINSAVIYKGMEKAIREKNENVALRTASFAQATNSTNPMAAAKAFDRNMLRYYDEVKDTANYFRKAIAYYERYLLSVSPDSIKRTDSINLRRMLATAKKDTVRDGNRMRLTAQVTYVPTVQRFSSELNEGAYNFYLHTENPYLRSIATEWAKRALEFYESPEALDTYAKLLYKGGQKATAVEQMNKAIELRKKRGFPTSEFEGTLAKMISNAKLTD